MKISTKILSILVLIFTVCVAILALISINTINKSQKENLRLFKTEFLELIRELFNSNSDVFYKALDTKFHDPKNPPTTKDILEFVKEIDQQGLNVSVIDINTKQFLYDGLKGEVSNLLNDHVLTSIINENTLNQKTDFSFDNYEKYSNDTSDKISPAKVNVHIYNDVALVVGYSKTFTSARVRVQFIQEQNQIIFKSFLQSFLIAIFITIIISVITIIVSMHNIVINPLKKITNGLVQVKDGNLSTKINIKQKDEIGVIASIFNTMTSDLEASKIKLENHSKDLENIVDQRTQELTKKVKEFEEMNTLMVGREIKMIELKKELGKLKRPEENTKI